MKLKEIESLLQSRKTKHEEVTEELEKGLHNAESDLQKAITAENKAMTEGNVTSFRQAKNKRTEAEDEKRVYESMIASHKVAYICTDDELVQMTADIKESMNAADREAAQALKPLYEKIRTILNKWNEAAEKHEAVLQDLYASLRETDSLRQQNGIKRSRPIRSETTVYRSVMCDLWHSESDYKEGLKALNLIEDVLKG